MIVQYNARGKSGLNFFFMYAIGMSFKTLPDVQSFEGDHSLFHNFFCGFRIHVRFLYYMEINNIWEMVLKVTDIQWQKKKKQN